MIIYKSLNEYAKAKSIHRLTACQRLKSKKIVKVFVGNKSIGYIDVVESIKSLSNLL